MTLRPLLTMGKGRQVQFRHTCAHNGKHVCAANMSSMTRRHPKQESLPIFPFHPTIVIKVAPMKFSHTLEELIASLSTPGPERSEWHCLALKNGEKIFLRLSIPDANGLVA
jgi:hypothetical protein